MPPSLQRVAFKAYTGIPTSVGSGTSTNLKAATDAVSSAASNAAEAANSAANTVMERMRANGWYGVHSSPPDGDGLSDDDCRSPSPQPRRGKAMKHIEDNHSEGESSSTGGEGWKIWQGAYDRVKWQSVGEKVKDAAAAVRKKYGTNDGLCESDEEDFQGPGDTHLTRIMKEYYIDNSRSTADLPGWLFQDVDRNSPSKAWEDTPARPAWTSRSHSSSRDLHPHRSRGSGDYDRDREYRSQQREDSYAERAYRSSLPSSSVVASGSPVPAATSRYRPNEHGSRIAEKLARMKRARNV